ncbi:MULTISPECIES: hypothetical protein [Ralstonia]|uniref:hypothetical protein n=1 Tax=Ralstonia TaxID=48736 RepID=UPI000386BA88|nr:MULTISPECIES: hypothetical protein [Ralstonia]EPX96160.1 hypothetical protein C404_20085 [Ralstonia sp. AU12-08]
MKVFVVIDDAMGGNQYAGVHRARPDVRQGNWVTEVNVVGVQTDPEFVYVAQTYDPGMDVHRFEGVYGNYDSAHHASGQRGLALRIKI